MSRAWLRYPARPVQPQTFNWRWALLPAAAFLIASISILVWIRKDHFLDREEAQHVMRALEEHSAAFGPIFNAREAFLARPNHSKLWYGFPSYLAVAVAWQIRGSASTDVGVAINVLFLALAAFSAAALAWRFAGPAAAMVAATFTLLLPGCLIWSHLFSPTLFLVGMTWAACAAIVWTDGGTRWWVVALAGVLACLAAIAKASTFFVWFPALLVALWDAYRIGRWKRTAVGLGIFTVAMLPAALWGWLARDLLAAQAHVFSMLFGSITPKAIAVAIAWRWYDNFLFFHAVLAVLGLLVLAVRSGHRGRALLIVFWILLPCFGAAILAKGAITGRDHLIGALPAVLAAACGVALLGRKAAAGVAAFLVLFGCVFVPVNLFGVGIDEPFAPPKAGILRSLPDGAPWAIRLVPHPDLLKPVITFLDGVLAGKPAVPRCPCLPQMPISTKAGQPLLFVDSGFIGPENLRVRLLLQGRKLPWIITFPPYPWACGAHQGMLSCGSAAVLSTGPPYTGYDAAERQAAIGRRRLARWGRSGGESPPVGALPGILVRIPAATGACTPEGELRVLEERCITPDYFTASLKALGKGRTAADVERARALVAERKAFLATPAGAAAFNLAETVIVEGVERQLAAINLKDLPPGGGPPAP